MRTEERRVEIPAGKVVLEGVLAFPEATHGIVLFAHGSGSSRFSPRNVFVAQRVQSAGLGTLLMDLLTAKEEHVDRETTEFRFDIPLLAGRVADAVMWAAAQPQCAGLSIGIFGASTGAAAALIASASTPTRAVVSRGGRPDLAGRALADVHCPVLLIVGGNDPAVLALNREALDRIPAESSIEVVDGATHLFEEPGALERVADLAIDWFVNHL
ncbi:MAG: dienelactone hydrolase family protein [Actinomycetota bacterium]